MNITEHRSVGASGGGSGPRLHECSCGWVGPFDDFGDHASGKLIDLTPNNERESCPVENCTGSLIPQVAGGVHCNKCSYWFCY